MRVLSPNSPSHRHNRSVASLDSPFTNGEAWFESKERSSGMPIGDVLPSKMVRLLKSNGAIFYNHKWRVRKGLPQDRSDIVSGFPVRQILIWQRAGGINFNPGYFLPNYEVIYLIAKPDFKLAPKANGQGCVWRINQENDNPHPAPFPVDLASRCIESVGKGPVLDPFMGSGTTAIAAEYAGVEWVGIEQSEQYVQMANDRINRVIARKR